VRECKGTEGEQFVGNAVQLILQKGASAGQVKLIKARDFEVDFNSRSVDLVRSIETEVTIIDVYRNNRCASCTINDRSADQTESAIVAALTAAEAGPADPAHDVADAISLPFTDHGPKEADRPKMISSVEEFIAELTTRYPLVRARNSLYHFSNVETFFANSRGLFQKQRRGYYGFDTVFMAKDGTKTTSFNSSGASAFSPFETLFDAGSIERLLDETVQSLERQPVPEKFIGDVIITPDCLASLIGMLAGALGGSALFAGTTPYKHSKGKVIASPLFSLFNRPRAPQFPKGADFDDYGIPTKDLDVVTDGMLNEFLVDYFFSRKLNIPQTGGTSNFIVAAGNQSVDEIVGNTKRGIFFSRFSGGAPNNNLDFNGVAKNSFYVVDGKVRHALYETMVTGNFQELLQNIHAVSRERVNFGYGSYPFVAASGITISSR
jgi:PmbA protein